VGVRALNFSMLAVCTLRRLVRCSEDRCWGRVQYGQRKVLAVWLLRNIEGAIHEIDMIHGTWAAMIDDVNVSKNYIPHLVSIDNDVPTFA
jgi:hypothetical protein